MIGEDGKQIGVVDLREALQMARERDLDLIQVTTRVDPPVCKIGDLGKHLYLLEKKERGKKKEGGLKEIRLTYNISPHDLETRVRQSVKFLKEGNQVRVRMRLRGREKAFGELAKEKIESFLEALRQEIPIKIIQGLRRKGGGLSLMIIKS